LISAILLVQFVGIPCTIAFGVLASRVGPKPTLYITLAFYTGIAIFAYFMRTATHFFVLAVAVGLVQGGCQALSRSLFASLIRGVLRSRRLAPAPRRRRCRTPRRVGSRCDRRAARRVNQTLHCEQFGSSDF
jgi:MFS family permease